MAVLSQDKFEAAFEWLQRGAELVPVQRDRKHIVKGYGPHQQRVAEVSDATLWFGQRRCNLAVLTGGPLGLACLDFDDPDSYAAWRNGPGLDVQTVIERTRRGFHVWAIGAHDLKACAGGGWELKAGGQAVLVAPSVVGGFCYQCLTDYPLAHIESVAFSPLSKKPVSPARPLVLPLRPSPNARGIVAKIKAAVPVLPIAEQLIGPLSGVGRYRQGLCPWHDDSRASFWVDTELNLWGCRSSNCPQHGTHDVVNLYGLVHQLDTQAAIRKLARAVAR